MWGGGVGCGVGIPQRLCRSLHTGGEEPRGPGRAGRCRLLGARQALPPPAWCAGGTTQPHGVVTGADPTCPAGPGTSQPHSQHLGPGSGSSCMEGSAGLGRAMPPWLPPGGSERKPGGGRCSQAASPAPATPPRAPPSACREQPPGQVRSPTTFPARSPTSWSVRRSPRAPRPNGTHTQALN